MSARVVCVSRVAMAGAETIGTRVAERLGFRYVDKEIVDLASAKANVDPELVERAEAYRSLLKRLFTRLVSNPVEPEAYDIATEPAPQDDAASGDLRAFIRSAIAEVAAEGSVVISAHGASIALGRAIGVLRVLITASEETRIERVRKQGLLHDEREAVKAVRESDQARVAYLRDFYGIKEEIPTIYDLVINTDCVTTDAAVEVVVAAARA